MLKSYIVNVIRGKTGPDTDRPCSVEVAACGESTGVTLKGSITQREARRGSCAALGAIHRGVGRVDERNNATRRPSHINQNSFCHPNRSIGRFFGQCGFGKKFGFKILNRQSAERGYNFSGPFKCFILAMIGYFGINFSQPLFGNTSSSGAIFSSGNLLMGGFQQDCIFTDRVSVMKIEGRACGTGNNTYSPIYTNRFVGWRKFLIFTPNHKRDIPMPLLVLEYNTRCWLAWKLSTPNNGYRNTSDKTKCAIFNSKCSASIFNGREGCFTTLKLWKSKVWTFKCLPVGVVPFTHSLRLSHSRALPKPFKLASKLSEIPAYFTKQYWTFCAAFFKELICSIPSFNTLVPNPTGAIPLKNQTSLSIFAGPQTVIKPKRGLVLTHAQVYWANISLSSVVIPFIH